MNRFLRLPRAAFAVLCLFGLTLALNAQSTTITASHLKMSGYPISTGLVTFTPVNSQEVPIPFADGTGAQNGPTAFVCHVTAGAIDGAISQTGTVSGSCVVPDATQTTPANILYLITVSDTSSGLRTSGYSYTMQGVIGVSGSSWALDHYGPPASTSNVATLQATQGTSLPSPCIAPSLFTLLNGSGAYQGTYTCVGGTEVALASGGTGSTGPAGPTGPAGAAATVTVGTTTTLAPGASATVTNSGTPSAAVLNFGIPQGAAGTGGGGGGSSLPSGTGLVKVVSGTGGLAVAGTDYDGPGAAASAQTAAEAAFTGDVSKSANAFATTVTGLQGHAISATAPAVGQGLIWTGSQYVPSTVPPAADVKLYPAAVCDGGTAFASGFTRYDNQQPQAGCDATATSVSAYLAFNAGTTQPQYAQLEVITPPYWTGTSAYIKFAGTATTGNVGWIVDTACVSDGQVVASASFGTATTVTTSVSATTGASVTTAIFTNIGVPGTNGCTAGTTTPGSILIVRVHRSSSDTQAGNANLYGMVLVTGRSQ